MTVPAGMPRPRWWVAAVASLLAASAAGAAPVAEHAKLVGGLNLAQLHSEAASAALLSSRDAADTLSALLTKVTDAIMACTSTEATLSQDVKSLQRQQKDDETLLASTQKLLTQAVVNLNTQLAAKDQAEDDIKAFSDLLETNQKRVAFEAQARNGANTQYMEKRKESEEVLERFRRVEKIVETKTKQSTTASYSETIFKFVNMAKASVEKEVGEAAKYDQLSQQSYEATIATLTKSNELARRKLVKSRIALKAAKKAIAEYKEEKSLKESQISSLQDTIQLTINTIKSKTEEAALKKQEASLLTSFKELLTDLPMAGFRTSTQGGKAIREATVERNTSTPMGGTGFLQVQSKSNKKSGTASTTTGKRDNGAGARSFHEDVHELLLLQAGAKTAAQKSTVAVLFEKLVAQLEEATEHATKQVAALNGEIAANKASIKASGEELTEENKALGEYTRKLEQANNNQKTFANDVKASDAMLVKTHKAQAQLSAKRTAENAKFLRAQQEFQATLDKFKGVTKILGRSGDAVGAQSSVKDMEKFVSMGRDSIQVQADEGKKYEASAKANYEQSKQTLQNSEDLAHESKRTAISKLKKAVKNIKKSQLEIETTKDLIRQAESSIALTQTTLTQNIADLEAVSNEKGLLVDFTDVIKGLNIESYHGAVKEARTL